MKQMLKKSLNVKEKFSVKDTDKYLKSANPIRFKPSVYAIFGHLTLMTDVDFTSFMMMEATEWLKVIMYAEGHKDVTVDDEDSSTPTLNELRSIVLKVYGKIMYYTNMRGHCDYNLDPVAEHFKICLNYLNDLILDPVKQEE